MARGRPDYSLTAVDVVSRPEWAAVEATDKTFKTEKLAAGTGDYAVLTYAVPAGKTLYITQATTAMWGDALADRDKDQVHDLIIYDVTADAYYCWLGGHAGIGMTFPKPVVIPAGHTLRVDSNNRSNHVTNIELVVAGYEV